MDDKLWLTKQQLELLSYIQDGGKVHVVYIPIVYAGEKAIAWDAYLDLLQQRLIESKDRGSGVESVTLTDEGDVITSQRRAIQKTVKNLKRYKQLELG